MPPDARLRGPVDLFTFDLSAVDLFAFDLFAVDLFAVDLFGVDLSAEGPGDLPANGPVGGPVAVLVDRSARDRAGSSITGGRSGASWLR
jgi:hypothetical protein